MAEASYTDFGSSASLSNLRELEEKLKCAKCTKIFQQPTSLTCGHIFCKECIPKYMVSVCPTCKARFLSRNLKPAVQIEEMLKKYQELDACTKVTNGDNDSPVRSFAEESSSVPTPQGILSVNGLGINAADMELQQLTREEPPEDSLVVDSTAANFSTPAGPSQVHVPDVENNLQLPPHDSKMVLPSTSVIKRIPLSSTNDSCLLPCMNPSTSISEITEKKQLAGSRGKRLKMTFSDVPVGLYEDECFFCHSFRRNLEGFGQLLCIQKGKVVAEPDMSSKAKVYYAHESCIVWSPEIYYEGDQIKNLRSEMQRSARLVCAKCGLRGATLGCFYEHCPKSYHPPCAYLVHKCRWDTVNYSMLCPDHVSEKLPCDSASAPSDPAANGNAHTSS